jgi:D-alanine-D-alanine ligase
MKQAMERKIRVAVLCGGSSSERDISLQTGHQVAESLPVDRYTVSVISIGAEGRWSLESNANSLGEKREIDARSLSKIADVVFIALHGKFGEDGTVQAILEKANIPYTGSGVSASALGMDKSKCSETVTRVSVPVPKFFLAQGKDDIFFISKKIEDSFGFPCVVKPNASGSSVGVSIVRSVGDVSVALEKAWREDAVAIVQQYIPGREFSCGVMGNTGQTEIEALPVVEIIPRSSEFFDYGAKYTPNASEEICPAVLSEEITAGIQKFSVLAHTTLGCDGLTRSDFRLDPDRNIFFLEINTIPGQTKTSLCPKEAAAAGMTFPEFLEKQVALALSKMKQ